MIVNSLMRRTLVGLRQEGILDTEGSCMPALPDKICVDFS
jgi:hypothetical protein